MSNLVSARALMGTSLAFHIIYVAVGIGLPFMLMIAEGVALKTGNEMYHQMARRWTRPMVVFFSIGAVSGTILSFELGLLWPRFMGFAGSLIGLPFWLEGFAFFVEGIFLGLYVYGERRLSRRALFLSTIPIVISSIMSAVFVISANSWMNTPAGFQLQNGNLINVQPLVAFASSAWAHEAIHGTLATYVAAAFGMAGIYALAMLRGKRGVYNQKALSLVLAVGGLTVPLMLVTGDYAATSVAADQPAKLAAMEGLFKTTKGAPLTIGGWPDPTTGQVLYGIQIPYLLSLLAYRNIHSTVKGLDAFPAGTTPNPILVHPFFDLMVGCFFIMFLAAIWFWWLRWRRGEVPMDKALLWTMLISSPLGFLAMEFGWFVTEFGRQPWIARNTMRVAEGVTPQNGIAFILLVFVLVYIALTIGLLGLLLRPAAQGLENGLSQEGSHGSA